MDNRISWDEYFMNITKDVALRGTCPRKQVGAIIIDARNQIIGTGYNGAPKGLEHCTEVGCDVNKQDHDERTVHAECNAILQAGYKAEGGTLYSTLMPCRLCLNMVIQVGIKRIVYLENYKNDKLFELCKKAKIEVKQYGS